MGSTKDYPGQWAGYSVYEGGIRQAVFRVATDAAIAWTEMTRRAMAGVWGWWSPGRLADRCWTLEWPDRVVPRHRLTGRGGTRWAQGSWAPLGAPSPEPRASTPGPLWAPHRAAT